MSGKLVVVVLLVTLIAAAQAGSTTSGGTSPTSPSPTSATTTASTSTPSTTTLSSSSTPRVTTQPCIENATVFESCLKNGLGLNTSQVSPPANYPCIGYGQCNSTSPVSTCSPNITTNASYGLLCTSSGLSLYPLSTNSCIEIYDTTDYMCKNALPLKGVHCTGSYDNHTVLTGTEAKNVSTVLASSCPKKTTPLPLLPNPVGPEAITAIVVLTCLTITAILAGFFFWPKCHIANPAAEAVKKATKPASAQAASAAAQTGAVSKTPPAGATTGGGVAGTGGGNSSQPYNVKYDGNRNTASVKVASLPGPSAA